MIVPKAGRLRRLEMWRDIRARGSRPGLLHSLDQDVRYALRTLGRGLGFTIAVVASLGIGIAATTTGFALVNTKLFRTFPEIAKQEELVQIKLGPRQGSWISIAWDDYRALRSGIPALADLSIAHQGAFAVAAGGRAEPQVVDGLLVSGNYFDVLGVRPARGRFFAPEEDAAPWTHPAVVVSYRFWQRHLAGDASVLQQTIHVNGASLPIIGVAPEGFEGVFASGDVWLTFALSDLVFRSEDGRPLLARDAPPFHATLVGRLVSSVGIEQARGQAAGLARPLAEARDRGLKELFVRVEPLRIVDPVAFAPIALALMAVPLIVLAIACVNAANLLLARATARSGEWLTRLSLGASRWRLVRQLLVESLLLSAAGAALGFVLCLWSAGYVQTLIFQEVVFDATVLLFVVLAAIGTAVVFGLGPALSVTRAAVSHAPAGGRSRGAFGSRTRAVLVGAQAALCLGLLATGAQFTKTLHALWDDGLPDAGQFLAVSIDVDKLRYGGDAAEAFYAELLTRVQALPEVRAAALSDVSAARMLGGLVTSWGERISIPGRADTPVPGVLSIGATAEFFDVMGVPLVQGRTFTAEEQRRPPRVVVVNEAFAKRAFGNDTLGRLVTVSPATAGDQSMSTDAMVVGVIAAPERRPYFSRLPLVFLPAPLTGAPPRDLLLRFDGDAGTVAAAVRTLVSTMDARLPVGRFATGEELRRRRNARDYTVSRVVSVLGVIALILAATGLYGVVAYVVTLRQKEIGIRMALGAQGDAVLRLVLRQSITPVLVGCAVGAFGAVVVATLVRSRLYGVSRMDPAVLAVTALILVTTMVGASLAPARRAARVDPIEVLRNE